MADVVRRQVTVIATPGNPAGGLAAKAATTTIPIVFGATEDPVKLGLVASLARPGGNATGINFFLVELAAKRLSLLHELVPKAGRVAVLINSNDASNAETTLTEVSRAARTLSLQIEVFKATTGREIEAAFASIAGAQADAVYVAADAFFGSRAAQFATLAASYAVPAIYPGRNMVEAGGLMSYGTDVPESYRQVGIYVGRILKGAKPADLPVQQSTKFELAINLQTARLLHLDVPTSLLAIADEVID
jgi:putative ABC transport system substrate-binding protein